MTREEMAMTEEDPLRREYEQLREENARLAAENKKLTRSARMLQAQIDRNRVTATAKDNLSRAVDAKRTELERYMNLLLNNCPDMILLFDHEGRLVYCTDSFLSACGLPSAGIIRGMSYLELLGTYASERLSERLAETYAQMGGERRIVEYSDLIDFGHGNTPRYYSIQIAPMLDENQGTSGSMIIFSDTTETHDAQMEAVRANAAKSDFLATVSHEIRTPMNAIIGVANMLKGSPLDARQHELLQNIQDSSLVLLNLINDILDFSKIEAGKLELHPAYFETGDMLGHLRSMFTLMFREKGLSFRCEFAPALPPVLYGDDNRIVQVLTNLLNNALKYTKQGEVVFRAYPDDQGRTVFEVTDTGIGIKAEDIDRLFSEFERVDAVRNKNITGTGLGLAICKRLCELMNGTISVRSVYGKGSTFTVVLPLPAGGEQDLPRQTRKEAIAFVAPEARVLVVDDIDINIKITEYILEGYHITADSAENGLEAVRMAQATAYDIILMDHMMPVMDGVESARMIRASSGPSRDTPIIALTANATNDAAEAFLRDGFNAFLPKPLNPDSLAECLLQWLPAEKVRPVDSAH